MIFKNKDKKFKIFIVSFIAFLLILICFSFVMFMNSIDYDFDNLFEGTTAVSTPKETKPADIKHSVSTLKGKNNLLFSLLNDEKQIEMVFIVLTDFDKGSMRVEVVEDNATLTGLYNESAEVGLKYYVAQNYGANIDKYAIFTKQQLKNALSDYNGITLNIPQQINYKSHEFNLLLDAGVQTVSGEIAYKYLLYCDSFGKENAICDIINSVLTKENLAKSDALFKSFVNSCVTDISIIDYSNSLETLNIYVNAEDKFLPKPYAQGE